MANTAFWVVAVAAWATRSVKAGVAKPASGPRRISKGKIDGSTPCSGWYNIRHTVMVPNRVATLRLGVLVRRRYQTPWKQIWLGICSVVRLAVIERPLDDDPAQFPKPIVQLSLKLVASLGSRLSPAESHDQATDLGDHRNQATVKGNNEVAK